MSAFARIVSLGTLASATLYPAAFQAAAPPPTFADLRYGTMPRQTLDVWKAEGRGKPTPVVVLFHGGHFGGGDKASFHGSPLLRPVLAAGVTIVAVNYRTLKLAPVQEIFHDAARSVQFLRSKAKEWNLDRDRIAAFGMTSGGTMALWLAFHDDLADPAAADPVLRESSRLRAVAAQTPQFTYDVLQWSEAIGIPHDKFFPDAGSLYGFGPEADLRSDEGRAIRASVDVRAFISPGDPPVYLFSPQRGGRPEDRLRYLNHPVHARLLKSRCDAAGVNALLFTPGDGGTAPPGGNDVAVSAFLLRELDVRRE